MILVKDIFASAALKLLYSSYLGNGMPGTEGVQHMATKQMRLGRQQKLT